MAIVNYTKMESRGQRYRLERHVTVGDFGRDGTRHEVECAWVVLGLDRCTRCDCPGPVVVERACAPDLRATCCGLQLGVGVQDA